MYSSQAMKSGQACVAMSIAMLAAPLVRQTGSPAAPPKPVVPVAASTLAANPDPYYGQFVSLIGAVDQALSKLAFSIDQNAQKAAKTAEEDVLILAPTLHTPVEADTYVTVLGEVVRFEPADLADKLKPPALDLAPDVAARYRGRPAVLATAVITAALVDLAKLPPPPLTPEEEAYDKVMKRVGPAFAALRKGIEGSDAAATREQTGVLKQAFVETEAFWKARRTADALRIAQDARRLVDAIDRAATGGQWEEVTTTAGDLGQTCQQCHATYREKLDDGSSRIRMPPR
jgi:cytochrome c556